MSGEVELVRITEELLLLAEEPLNSIPRLQLSPHHSRPSQSVTDPSPNNTDCIVVSHEKGAEDMGMPSNNVQ